MRGQFGFDLLCYAWPSGHSRRRVGRLAVPASDAARRARTNRQKGRDVERLEQQLSDALSAPVEIRVKKRTSKGDVGEIAIAFASLDELDGLLARFGHTTQ